MVKLIIRGVLHVYTEVMMDSHSLMKEYHQAMVTGAKYLQVMLLLEDVYAGDCEQLLSRLKRGADPNLNLGDDSSPLMEAIDDNKINCVQILLDNNANPYYQDSRDGDTALIVAARLGNKECVQLVLQHNADLNLQNHCGETALICAANNGNTDNVKMLLIAGADYTITDKNGCTALTIAIKRGYADCVDILSDWMNISHA